VIGALQQPLDLAALARDKAIPRRSISDVSPSSKPSLVQATPRLFGLASLGRQKWFMTFVS
jgi:hypothetical protein